MDQPNHIISLASPPNVDSWVATESSDEVGPYGRELAVRASNGTQVRLLWQRGTGQLWVEVLEPATAWALRIEAQPENALDVFYHPYAYARLQKSPREAEALGTSEGEPQVADEKHHG